MYLQHRFSYVETWLTQPDNAIDLLKYALRVFVACLRSILRSMPVVACLDPPFCLQYPSFPQN
jgi:hypothetical protein